MDERGSVWTDGCTGPWELNPSRWDEPLVRPARSSQSLTSAPEPPTSSGAPREAWGGGEAGDEGEGRGRRRGEEGGKGGPWRGGGGVGGGGRGRSWAPGCSAGGRGRDAAASSLSPAWAAPPGLSRRRLHSREPRGRRVRPQHGRMGCGGSRADAIEPRYYESWTRETESTWLTYTDSDAPPSAAAADSGPEAGGLHAGE